MWFTDSICAGEEEGGGRVIYGASVFCRQKTIFGKRRTKNIYNNASWGTLKWVKWY